MNSNLHLYSIVPLDTDHIDEVCEDIKYQYESGISNFPLFMMTLVPEGDPPVDKASKYCAKYKLFKEKLEKMGIPCGVLVQATIGHGWTLGAMFPYQPYIALRDGEPQNTVCPLDRDFHEYLRHIFKTIAETKPMAIMVDDDFRLMGRAWMGCACPLHMAQFNRLAGTEMSREELFAILGDPKHPENSKYGPIFESTQHDCIIEAAKVMRESIDSVDPSIPGSFCCVGNSTEYAAEIAAILAGKGNPTVVRVNNGHYCRDGGRDFTRPFLRAAHQIAKLRGKVDIILAETDTCPQNRYSTGAMQLHTHFTGTLIEGAKGAKHWITRLASHEPQSGKAYRHILSKNQEFYEALADIVPTLKWRGCRIPVSSKAFLHYSGLNDVSADGWCRCVLEELGLPMYFSSENGGILCLDGRAAEILSDDQIKKALGGTVITASDSAKQLIDRGFGEYLGVDVRDWNGLTPKNERLSVDGHTVGVQQGTKELVPLNDQVAADSTVCNSLDGESFTELFPGSTVFKNSLGGTSVVFCVTPQAAYNIVEAFSFLNVSRKLQLIRIMKNAGELPIYCPGDEPLYVRAADMQDGGLFTAIFNLGTDTIDNAEIVCERKVSRIEKLMCDGSRMAVEFTKNGEVLTLDCSANVLDPLILFIY